MLALCRRLQWFLRSTPALRALVLLAITPDGRKVYVSSDGASTVSVIDTPTDTIVKSIEVGPNPHGLAISADGREVLVGAFGTNQVLLIDTSTDQIVQR